MVGELGLGNRWQIGKFTIGCDWVGVILPISSSTTTSSTKNSSLGLWSTDSDFDVEASEVERNNLVLTKVQLGFSF